MNPKTTPISFALAGIQTIEFATLEEAYSENENITTSISVEFGIESLDSTIIVCSPTYSFLQKGIPFIKIKAACFFDVKKESWGSYINKSRNSITFPKGFTDHLLVLSLGTLRGLLHAKTEGTIFNKYFIPTTNVVELSNDDITINLDI